MCPYLIKSEGWDADDVAGVHVTDGVHSQQNPFPYLLKARSQSQISTNRNSLHDKSLHTPNILLEKLIPNSSPSSTRPNSPVVLRKFGSLRLSGLKHEMSSINTIANETNTNNNSNNNNNNNNSSNNHNNNSKDRKSVV